MTAWRCRSAWSRVANHRLDRGRQSAGAGGTPGARRQSGGGGGGGGPGAPSGGLRARRWSSGGTGRSETARRSGSTTRRSESASSGLDARCSRSPTALQSGAVRGGPRVCRAVRVYSEHGGSSVSAQSRSVVRRSQSASMSASVRFEPAAWQSQSVCSGAVWIQRSIHRARRRVPRALCIIHLLVCVTFCLISTFAPAVTHAPSLCVAAPLFPFGPYLGFTPALRYARRSDATTRQSRPGRYQISLPPRVLHDSTSPRRCSARGYARSRRMR